MTISTVVAKSCLASSLFVFTLLAELACHSQNVMPTSSTSSGSAAALASNKGLNPSNTGFQALMDHDSSTKREVPRAATSGDLRERLTPQQWSCTQESGTERPFANEFWDHKEDGIYVDIVDGKPLFSSLDKYDSHSGWPSFTQPISSTALEQQADTSHGMARQEVRSQGAKSHLGHVFDDGPSPLGKRFCINSASLRFVPVDQLRQQGYEDYLFIFSSKKGWEIATLAGGCFWGVQELLAQQPGVLATRVGYAGGKRRDVSYESVCTGTTGHAEAVQVLFDPAKTTYTQILHFFFEMHDPTTLNRQANDRGTQYRSAIFYSSAKQQQLAQEMIMTLNLNHQFSKPVVTEVVSLPFFSPAENYHQHYLEKNPQGYRCHVVKSFTWPQKAKSF